MIKIDTRFGTANTSDFSNGNCLPFTSTPHPMNYFAPQTDASRGAWWFHPNDKTFEGVRVTHQASPWIGDFGTFLLQPVTGEVVNRSIWGSRSSYDTQGATFSPSKLELFMYRYQTALSLVPSRYGAKMKLTYEKEAAGLLLHLGEKYELLLTSEHTLQGWVSNFADCEDKEFTLYFSLYFEQPIKEIEENYLRFGNIYEQEITLATSFISSEQANLNLSREYEKTFQEMEEEAENEWQEVFGKITVTHSKQEEVALFYQNMYRAFLYPTCFYELDEKKQAIHYQTKTKTVEKGVYYTNNGFWDTGKTVYPLYSLIAQEKLGEMLEAYLNVYREVGFLPKWLAPDERGMMPGMGIDPVIADCLSKGIRLDLAEEFLEAMLHSATVRAADTKYGRASVSEYNELGYVPTPEHESVNQTLDNALSDYSIAKVAGLLGKEELVKKYQDHATMYRTLIDPETKLMRAKDAQGNFKENFDTLEWGGDYTEGSAWQNSFLAVHDLEGYIATIGKKEFSHVLTELCNQDPQFGIGSYGFEIHEMSEMVALNFGQVAISNQPSLHVPYLFNFVGEYASSEVLLKNLLKQAFSNDVTAYPGDEDNGSLACWFLFSSLGFYPVVPAKGSYEIGIPLFDKVEIHCSSGKTWTIRTKNNTPQHTFVSAIKRTGDDTFSKTLTHEAIMQGGEMEVTLGIVPRITKEK